MLAKGEDSDGDFAVSDEPLEDSEEEETELKSHNRHLKRRRKRTVAQQYVQELDASGRLP